MRRANVQLAADRRSEILAAAQTCFARAGFHQTSMQEICAEAVMPIVLRMVQQLLAPGANDNARGQS